MTNPEGEPIAPQPGKRRPNLPIVPIIAALAVMAIAALFVVQGLDGPGPQPTPTALVRNQPLVSFGPEMPGGSYETAVPITVSAKLPLIGEGDERSEPRSVLLEVVDAAGNAAIFDGNPGEPQAMAPTGIDMSGHTSWTAVLSTPTEPGVYHTRLIADAPNLPRQTFEQTSPTITVVTPTVTITSGFVFQRYGNLWITSNDGQHTRKLTFYPSDQAAGEPEWSPDGTKIAYTRIVPAPIGTMSTSDIWTLDPLTGEKTLVAEHQPGEGLSFSAWTPNNQLLVTVDSLIDPATGATPTAEEMSTAADLWSIEQVDLASGERKVVMADAVQPHLSADGTMMAFVARLTDPAINGSLTSIGVANGDGSDPRVIVPPGDFLAVYRPRISPDKTMIAFTAVNNVEATSHDLWGLIAAFLLPTKAYAHDIPWDIYVVPVEGGEARRITQMDADQPAMSWGSSSDRIAVLSEGGLFVVPLDGGDLTRLTPGDPHGHMSWYEK